MSTSRMRSRILCLALGATLATACASSTSDPPRIVPPTTLGDFNPTQTQIEDVAVITINASGGGEAVCSVIAVNPSTAEDYFLEGFLSGGTQTRQTGDRVWQAILRRIPC